MIFDVMIKEVEKNAAGKDVFNVFRVHDVVLSIYLRRAQDNGKYIVSVIPLFRPKMKKVVARHIMLQDESAFNKEEVAMNNIGGYTPSDDFGFVKRITKNGF